MPDKYSSQNIFHQRNKLLGNLSTASGEQSVSVRYAAEQYAGDSYTGVVVAERIF